MDEIEQSDVDTINDENLETSDQETVEQTPEPAPKKEWTLEQKLARVDRMKAKLEKELGIDAKPKETPKSETKGTPGELDETQLDYLDLKGISDEDEIAVIQTVIAKTGQTVRQVLKDDYVQAKLEKLRADKAVKDATPSSTKRSGPGQSNDVAAAIAKFEQTGSLPDDYSLRTAVVNALESKTDVSKPRWQR